MFIKEGNSLDSAPSPFAGEALAAALTGVLALTGALAGVAVGVFLAGAAGGGVDSRGREAAWGGRGGSG